MDYSDANQNKIMIESFTDSRKVNATPCGITEVASLPTISRRGRFAGEWDLTNRINLNDINFDSQPTQYTVLYLTVFAVSLAAIASVIGTAYKVEYFYENKLS